ncbi:MAG: heavy-metal-associated domain-containing protein [Pseudomonadota bacterium]|nr:heavy-metal-associated domain-containing protein [Pseudomonadota bacterium]
MDIVDILIHIHPDLQLEQREKVEETLRSRDGVVSVHFSPEHSHELTVAYDPEAINSSTILEQIRQWDTAASMAGL